MLENQQDDGQFIEVNNSKGLRRVTPIQIKATQVANHNSHGLPNNENLKGKLDEQRKILASKENRKKGVFLASSL